VLLTPVMSAIVLGGMQSSKWYAWHEKADVTHDYYFDRDQGCEKDGGGTRISRTSSWGRR